MDVENDLKNELKKEIRKTLLEIYENCNTDYTKYVERVEELEKQGILKTDYIRRENMPKTNIWNE